MKIDLHGYQIHAGWLKFRRDVNEAYFSNYKKCVVITGQGSMMKEFPIWAENHPYIREWSQTKYNPGSFTIKLKKKG